MVVYFLISLIFGGGFGLIMLIVHEDNDRCHYYHGEWNKGDLTRGCIAIAVCTDESIDELNNKNGNGKDECHEEMITCESGKT